MSVNFEGLQGRSVESYADALEFRRAIEQLIPTLRGDGRYVIPRGNEFWNFYHAHKEELRHARLFVFKDGSEWVLGAKPLYDPNARKKELLQERLQQWKPHLKGCCVGFIEMQIFEKVQRNGVKRYLLWCPKCQKAISSALPYSVVEHLLKDIGLELLTEAENLDESGGYRDDT